VRAPVAPSGALRASVPGARCNGTLRLVGEVILCEASVDASRRQVVALEPHTLATRWSRALLPGPTPSPWSASGR
jgi:hypothetical protein